MIGKYPHIEWIDLNGNNVVTECAILKKDPEGNIYFFTLNSLDLIDKKRLLDIVTNRNANMYELWDLMSQITMRNGVNALVYFHQLAKVLTPSGQVIECDPSRRGLALQNRIDVVDQDPAADVRRGRAAAPAA
jgi:hypothetical protein